MSASRCEAGVREHGGVAVVDLSGEIDAGAEESLNGAYDTAAANDGAELQALRKAIESLK